jgi:hypothetical protein
VLAAALLFAAGPARAQEPAAYCGPALFTKYPLPRPFGPSLGPLTCRAYVVEAPKATLTLAVAATGADRERGLMDVRSLAPATGMFFAFPDGDQKREFWMMNTLIPLDMIFIESSGRINAIAENVPSSTYDMGADQVARRRGTGAYVIELRAGDAKAAGLRVGIRLGLPPLGITPA